jgi:hypothetical protein
MRARYARYEIGSGVYPVPPACLAKGGMCAQVITFLYPDGTFGGGGWVFDPESRKGWSECVYDENGKGPAACG